MAHRPSWLKRVTNAARNEALFPVTDLDLFLHKKGLFATHADARGSKLPRNVWSGGPLPLVEVSNLPP